MHNMSRDIAAVSHVHALRVYWEDTDAAGIVYYANYLKYAERARSEILYGAGIDQTLGEPVGDGVVRIFARRHRCGLPQAMAGALIDDQFFRARDALHQVIGMGDGAQLIVAAGDG